MPTYRLRTWETKLSRDEQVYRVTATRQKQAVACCNVS